jgi:hypothetical protein
MERHARLNGDSPVDGCLRVRTRDASWRCDLLDVLGGFLSCVASNRFRILTARPHVPRVQIDDLVIVRETWRASFEDLAFVMTENESELFLEARRWARSLGMPRFVFVRTPGERKPWYVDFLQPGCSSVRSPSRSARPCVRNAIIARTSRSRKCFPSQNRCGCRTLLAQSTAASCVSWLSTQAMSTQGTRLPP